MEEVFNSAFIADESEALVDEKPCNRAGRHTDFSDESACAKRRQAAKWLKPRFGR